MYTKHDAIKFDLLGRPREWKVVSQRPSYSHSHIRTYHQLWTAPITTLTKWCSWASGNVTISMLGLGNSLAPVCYSSSIWACSFYVVLGICIRISPWSLPLQIVPRLVVTDYTLFLLAMAYYTYFLLTLYLALGQGKAIVLPCQKGKTKVTHKKTGIHNNKIILIPHICWMCKGLSQNPSPHILPSGIYTPSFMLHAWKMNAPSSILFHK